MASQRFYYDSGTEKLGPISGAELLRLLASGEVTRETWVRRENSTTWRPLASIDLSKEQEQEKKRTVRRALWNSLSPTAILGIICLLAFLVALIYVGILAVQLLWPIILVVIIASLIMRVMK